MSPSFEEKAKRYLIAVFRLAKGRAEVAVLRADVLEELRRERLFELTDEEFDAYHDRVLAEADEYRRLHGN